MDTPQTPPTAPPEAPSTPQPTKPTQTMLDRFCTYIRDFEGKPGDRNYRNNNPGNFRCSPVGYLPKYGAVKCIDKFAVFPTAELGWEYLTESVHHRATIHPDWTIFEFFAGRLQLNGQRAGGYAPSGDDNSPEIYAANVAARCGVPVSTTLKQLFG